MATLTGEVEPTDATWSAMERRHGAEAAELRERYTLLELDDMLRHLAREAETLGHEYDHLQGEQADLRHAEDQLRRDREFHEEMTARGLGGPRYPSGARFHQRVATVNDRIAAHNIRRRRNVEATNATAHAYNTLKLEYIIAHMRKRRQGIIDDRTPRLNARATVNLVRWWLDSKREWPGEEAERSYVARETDHARALATEREISRYQEARDDARVELAASQGE